MPRFFIDPPQGKTVTITGADATHIGKSLRMQAGETLTLCDGMGLDYTGTITTIEKDSITIQLEDAIPSKGEPNLAVTVYQGIPKGEKLDTVAQKLVECGGSGLVPVLTARSISRPEEKAREKKRLRLEKIMKEASMQCGRGKVITPSPFTTLEQSLKMAAKEGDIFFFYEGGGMPLAQALEGCSPNIGIFIGPEGGFAEEEVALAKEYGAKIVGLGPRIFRTETAATAALCAIMALTGNL